MDNQVFQLKDMTCDGRAATFGAHGVEPSVDTVETKPKNKHDLLSEDTKPYYYLTPSNMEPPEYERQRRQRGRQPPARTSRWARWKRSILGPQLHDTDDHYFEIGGSHESLNETDAVNAQLTHSEEKIKFTQQSYLALAIISTVFFNIPVGIIAIVCSLQSANAFSHGDRVRARRCAHCSVVLSLVAMVTTVTAVLIVVFYVSSNKANEYG